MSEDYIPKSKEWFMERIGKRIFRDMQGETHCCSTCRDAVENGLIVIDEEYAEYLACIDAEFASEGIFSNYRDKK